jgi:hypothetical protein
MSMKRAFRLVRAGPDYLTDELTAALAADTWFEFKPLFSLVHANLRKRNLADGGEEMLRLRAYEKLQNLVRYGLVEKSEKHYRGIPAQLADFAERLAAERCRHLLNQVKQA